MKKKVTVEVSYADQANQYARDVIAGKVNVGTWVHRACERHLNDLAKSKSKSYPYVFNPPTGRTSSTGEVILAPADRICKFAEAMVHIKGKWSGKPVHLEPWQIFLLGCTFGWLRKSDGLRRYREIYWEIPRKNAKALALDTPIPTPTGWSTMGRLKVGDWVFGLDGMPVKVLAATGVMYGHECYELELTDGEKITADAGHRWVTDARQDRENKKGVRGKTKGPKPSVKTTEEIASTIFYNEDLNHRIALPKPIQCKAVEFDIAPYVLGAWLGDGTSDSGHIAIGNEDSCEMVKAIRQSGESISRTAVDIRYLVGSDGPVTTNSKGQFQSNNSFHSRLRRAGLILNKHIPEKYQRASEFQRMELLQGLMDTDGSISKAGQCTFTNTNKRIIDGMMELLFGLGYKPLMAEFTPRLNGRDIGRAWMIQFWAWADRPCFKLPRKCARLRENPGKLVRSSTRQIIRCDKVASVPVRCIQVDATDGMFLAGRSFLPTHNSTMGAIIGLYLAFVDDEMGAEVYAGATTMEQAYMVFRPAWMMVHRNPDFKSHFGLGLSGTENNPNTIYQLKSGSRFEPIIGKPGDGSSPHGAIIDEYHEHQTSDQYNAMKTGMGARTQPLRVLITTAGTDTSGPCFLKHQECEKVLNGLMENEELFTVIYSIDLPDEQLKTKGDDWTDIETAKKVNPNFGISVFADYLVSQIRDGKQSADQQSAVLTKNFNVWLSAGRAWMNMVRWNLCARPKMRMEDYLGEDCWLAVDLASKINIAALAIIFKTKDGGHAFFARHYLPNDTVEQPENAHLRRWRDEGYIIATDGPRTDLRQIENDIQSISKEYAVQQLGFDQRESNYLISNIQEWASFDCIEVPQSPAQFNEPMKEMEAQIYAETLWHPADPCMTWQMGNVVKKPAQSGGTVKYYYPTKTVEKNNIDAIVAGIMALSLAMKAKDRYLSFSGVRSVG